MDFKTWVSDRVLSTLGISEPTVVDYMISKAKSCSSGSSLLEELVKVADIPSDPKVLEFLNDLVQRVPQKRKTIRPKEDVLEKNIRYSLLTVEELPEDVKLGTVKKKKSFKKRAKEDVDSSSNSDADVKIKDDIRERDEFAARLKERDKLKTKNVEEKKYSTREEKEAAERKRLALDREARLKGLPDLRVRSRQEYLKKREEQRLELLSKKIQDEEMLFKGEELTYKERQELELNKQVLKLTKERLQLAEKIEGYVMPEDYITEKGKIDSKKQKDLLYGRYKDTKHATQEAEQDSWEQGQINKSLAKLGTLDTGKVEDEYGFVFDEDQQVNFILDSAIAQEELKNSLDSQPKMTIAEKKGINYF